MTILLFLLLLSGFYWVVYSIYTANMIGFVVSMVFILGLLAQYYMKGFSL